MVHYCLEIGGFMKTGSFLFFAVILALFFSSCEISVGGAVNTTPPSGVPPRTFWAQDMTTDRFYQLEAELLAETSNCRVWVEKGSGVSESTAASMAKTYENDILKSMLSTFGVNSPIMDNGQVVANNTMELADYLGDGDGKLSILLLDIRDGYKPGVNDGYVGGYFWAVNFFQNDPSDSLARYSNACDMIYIDTYPGEPGSKSTNATFAHEMQHMMSFVSYFISGKQNLLDTWVDEGLSSAAEWVYLGEHNERWSWYNADRSGLIQKGNNFFVWDNRDKESQYAVLDDYATVYLFFQWLRLQSGGTGIYQDIIMSDYYDHRAVTTAADKAMGGRGYNNWGTLLKTWLAANYINAASGPYGYRNDGTLKGVKARTAPEGTRSILLYPGEGVYSITNNFNLPVSNQNIYYAGLNKSGNALSDTATYQGGALLTYNVNTSLSGSGASGTTTGVGASITSRSAGDIGNGEGGFVFSGPYAIGAGDLLRRKGSGENTGLELSKLSKGHFSIE